ncbi:GrpB family protein [Streptomyces himalayensis]|uniref:GrpB family protein n=1 Tax=Streptomyces himalayensis subsp. himalayensis TaxID=2756131 RepID=A0A7W0DMT3_9ACTN|nr:GrpB family protein [Streptomyces himalayensis]MBA2947956.1 GrpB family protein [Streptomyces himalayensis subsp. himalayensis]
MLAVVSDVGDVLKDHAALEQLGYEYRPGSFADDGEHLFFRKVSGGKRTHHLHVLAASAPRSDDYLLFRDYLVAGEDAAQRYEQAKQYLAGKYATERGGYVAEKSQIVDQLMSEARAWRAAGSDS